MNRSAALWLTGLWLGLLVASWVSATASFRAVDRVLGPVVRPEIETRLASVAAADRRLVLRHLASEINRWMFRRWAIVQALLALVLVIAAWPGGGASRLLALALFVVVLIQLVGLGPPIARLGESLDFVPRPLPADVARSFGLLHGGFVLLDLAKAVVLVALAFLVARRPLP